MSVDSRLGAWAGNGHSTRGGKGPILHEREDESLGWTHGPFRRTFNVKVKVKGKVLRSDHEAADLTCDIVTPLDNVPIKHAAAYAKRALLDQNSCTDDLVVGDLVMINGLSMTGGWMEAVIERRARKVSTEPFDLCCSHCAPRAPVRVNPNPAFALPVAHSARASLTPRSPPGRDSGGQGSH